MTEEETRALAYQDSLTRKAEFRRTLAVKLHGSPSAYRGLFNRTKALIGEIANDERQEEPDRRNGQLGSL